MRSAEKCAKKHRVFAKEKYVFFHSEEEHCCLFVKRRSRVQSAECKKQGCAFVQRQRRGRSLLSPPALCSEDSPLCSEDFVSPAALHLQLNCSALYSCFSC